MNAGCRWGRNQHCVVMDMINSSCRLTLALIASLGALVFTTTASADHRYHSAHNAGSYGALAIEAPGLTYSELRQMRDPVVVDKSALHHELINLEKDIRDLERIASLIADKRLRDTLCVQIERMKERTTRIDRRLRSADRIQLAEVTTQVIHLDAHSAVSQRRFAAIVSSIKGATFSNDKMQTLKSIASTNQFTTRQVGELARLFTFNNQRLEVLTYLYPMVIDYENYHQLLSLLPYSSDRRALLKSISEMNQL